MPGRSPLTVVYKQMQVWLALVGLTYIALFSLEQSAGVLYDGGSFVFGSRVWLIVSGAVVSCGIMLLAGVDLARDRLRRVKRFLIIVCLIYLLALLVLLTGGFIDSPFSGAISLYLGFFIALIQAGKYRGLSSACVLMTVAFITAPYVYLCWQDRSIEILKWHATTPTAVVRLGITISLLLITGWYGGKASNELKDLADSGSASHYLL